MKPYQSPDGTWRIDGVPIVTTGIEYPLSSGPKTFTVDELADAVKAIGDPAIKVPRLKLGHTSGYNASLIGDAEQAFGRVENLTIGHYGQTIYGDYVGMPEWLAKVAPIAYPSRSIEGDTEIVTNTGHNYAMVIYAVSLLGVRWPGCSTLEDLPLYYGSEIPSEVEIDYDEDQIVAASKKGVDVKPGDRLKAAVDIDLVDRKFYSQFTYGDEQYYWWIRAERYDDSSGLQLIVDCDDGSLVRIPVKVKGSDVSFGDPVEVTEEYPDKIAAASFVAGMAASERALGADVIIHASRADTHGDRPEVKATQGGSMDDATRRALASRVGLDPETATEEEVNGKITEMFESSQNDDENDTTDKDGTVVTPVADAPDALGAVPPLPVAAGTVTVDKETWDTVRAQAAQGAEVAASIAATTRDNILDGAVKAGKIPPARREHYAKMYAADPQGTVETINSLAEGLVPVVERGNAGNGEEIAGGGSSDGLEGMDARLADDIKNIRAGNVPGRSHRVMQSREA